MKKILILICTIFLSLSFQVHSAEIVIINDKPGTGKKIIKHSWVQLEYTGSFENGKVFDTNVGKGKVKIVNEELLFHKTLLNDFTNQKLIDNWYYSGDIIEWIDKKHFIIVNRNSNYINVGGHRVNLIEVEETLLGINQIREARVFSKSNSILGNIIGVEYKGEIDSRNLHILLRGLLESHKVPTILKKVDQIPLTQTGKKKRI